MSSKKLIWQLFPSYLVITVAALLAITWYSSTSLRQFYYNEVAADLQARAVLIERQLVLLLAEQNLEAVDEICKRAGLTSHTRITVVLPDGKVIADSDEDPAIMRDHSDRPELIDAISGDVGKALRFSSTLGEQMMYVAIPINLNNEKVAIVRTSLSVTAIDKQLKLIYTRIAWALIIVAVLAAGISLIVSRRLIIPVERMTATAKRFAAGELDLRLPRPRSSELAELAQAMNEMAIQLSDRIDTITEQKNESEAILASMIEGVLAIDATGHLVSMNNAAANLLDVDAEKVQSRNIEEIFRNPDVQKFITDTLAGKGPSETDVFMQADGGRYFHVNGAKLASKTSAAGAVIVLNDMTRMRRLEEVRRDFVANVSHELKTPITSIKGFVETLLEGAIKEPAQAKRFLQIIAKHSDRLNAIIEDLLSLSRLEIDTQQRSINFEPEKISTVIESAVEFAQVKAQQKQINLDVDCAPDLAAPINAPLMEQAILNLIDNAVKYSDTDSTVSVTVDSDNDNISISVSDTGCGIEKKHLARIFERFYVVDKGRSRKLGGTGLGLAIVKHISNVHGGYVAADSTAGEGSTFTIVLPETQTEL